MCLSGANVHFFFFLDARKYITNEMLNLACICPGTMVNFCDLHYSNGLFFYAKINRNRWSKAVCSDSHFRHNSVEESCISCKESISIDSIELYALTFYRMALLFTVRIARFGICFFLYVSLFSLFIGNEPSFHTKCISNICHRWTHMRRPIQWTHNNTKIAPPVVLMFVHKYSI